MGPNVGSWETFYSTSDSAANLTSNLITFALTKNQDATIKNDKSSYFRVKLKRIKFGL